MFNKIDFEELSYDENNNRYLVNKCKKFHKKFYISDYNYNRCFDFAFDMASENKHRETRSGGRIKRKPNQVFADALIGKLGECAVDQFMYFSEIETDELDFEVHDRNIWDTYDLIVNKGGKKEFILNIKTTKSKGNLLLLETKDWNSKGYYKPNGDEGYYDFFLFVRIDIDVPKLMKKEKIFYNDDISDKDLLDNLIKRNRKKLFYDIVGYITQSDLVQIISENRILPQNSNLGYNSTKMDAENYYVQSGNMRGLQELITYIKDN